jgi:hypothetical protein
MPEVLKVALTGETDLTLTRALWPPPGWSGGP